MFVWFKIINWHHWVSVFIIEMQKLKERVSTMKLYGKFCIEGSSEQLYITKHCAEPNIKTFYEKTYSKTEK